MKLGSGPTGCVLAVTCISIGSVFGFDAVAGSPLRMNDGRSSAFVMGVIGCPLAMKIGKVGIAGGCTMNGRPGPFLAMKAGSVGVACLPMIGGSIGGGCRPMNTGGIGDCLA